MVSDTATPEFYVDQFRITSGPYGVAITFGLTPPHPSPGQVSPPRDLALIRMSLEHAKIMTLIMRRQLKQYERDNGVTIEIPHSLYAGLGVSPEDW